MSEHYVTAVLRIDEEDVDYFQGLGDVYVMAYEGARGIRANVHRVGSLPDKAEYTEDTDSSTDGCNCHLRD